MGVSIRVDAWRYTEWRRWRGDDLEPAWGASGLVAPRLTVKSSALNAATLEVKSQRRST